MTPTTHCYFDYYQGQVGQPKAIGGYLPIEKVYEFEPVVPGIPADKAHHVLGGGANLWTEYIPNYGHLQYMTYPRACALAETLWSPIEGRQLANFKARLKKHFKFLDSLGVLYGRILEFRVTRRAVCPNHFDCGPRSRCGGGVGGNFQIISPCWVAPCITLARSIPAW